MFNSLYKKLGELYRSISLFVSFVVLFAVPLQLFATDISFSALTTLDGLSQNDVNCIHQDKNGFIWIGTFDGLNRYDGYDFMIFQVSPRQLNGLSSNLIYRIVEDSFGNLWLGSSDEGLIKFNYNTNTFYSLDDICFNELPEHSNRVGYVHCDKQGTIWIGTTRGGFILTPGGDGKYLLTQFSDLVGDPGDVMKGSIRHVFEDDDGSIILSGDYGLYFCTFDRQGTSYHIKKIHKLSTYAQRVNKIYEQYVVFNDEGIFTFKSNKETSTFELGKQLHDAPFLHAILDRRGELWCSGPARKGVYRFNVRFDSDNVIQLQEIAIYGEEELGKTMVTALHEDVEGNVWMGLNGGGIRRYIPNSNKFQHYHKTDHPGSLGYNKVRAIFEDRDENLWIGTEGGGISFLPYRNKQNYTNGFVTFSTNAQSQYADDSYCFGQMMGETKVYSGTNYPTFCIELNPYSKGFGIQKADLMTDGRAVFDIYADTNNVMWLATYSAGLFAVYPSTDSSLQKVITYQYDPKNPKSISSNIIRSVLEDYSGNMWIGTHNGLNLLLKSDKYRSNPQFIKFKSDPLDNSSISHDYILPLFQTESGEIWIGTMGGGVNKLVRSLNIEDSKFEAITTKDGLPNNVIKAILEDNNGELWISTNRGLTRFNPQNMSIVNYDISEGLQDYEFSEMAACKRKNGDLIFGGVNGFNVITPKEIRGDTTHPRIVLTEFHILNQVLHVGEVFNGRVILNQSLVGTKQIKLKHAENSIAFHFSALHYTTPEKNQYEYRLEGFDQDWILTFADNRIAKYTYLPPGKYTFQVKGSNPDGVWCKQPASIQVVIIPPWFRSMVAYCGYVIILFAILIFMINYNRSRNKRKTELKMARFEKEKIQELSQMKLKFYTNISHEFRTPLTLIIGPIERLIYQGDKLSEHKRKETYSIIQRNASMLLRLINQLMDFRKMEQDKMELAASQSDIASFINDISVSFKEYAKQRKLDFKINLPELPVSLWFDNDKIEKVIYNLLSNAFKFTQPNGSVTLSIIDGEDKVIIKVEDTGLGMTKEAQKHIFERFYQSKHIRYHQGGSTGIGLVLTKGLVELHMGSIYFESKLNKGSVFFVELPKGSNHLSDEEKLSYLNSDREVNTDSIKHSNEHIDGDKNTGEIVLGNGAVMHKLLIIEDNDELRNYLTDSFSEKYEVINAIDGVDGFEMCINNQPDIVISDVMMPRMNGFELCEKIKKDERTSHIPIVLLTAKTAHEAKLIGYRTGADGYVTKPFKYEVLEAQIHSILQTRYNLHIKYQKSTDINPTEVTMTAADAHFLERLITIIEENIRDDKFSVELLADSYGMTQNLMNKKLKSLTGHSSKAFIRSIRMKRAAQLLRLGRYMVSDVTYEVGMNDLKYFRQCFKAEFGVTPSEYIKQNTENN